MVFGKECADERKQESCFSLFAKRAKERGKREAASPIVFASVRKLMSGKGLEENLASRFVQSVRKLLKERNLNGWNGDLLQGKELAGLGCEFTRKYSTRMIASQVTVLKMYQKSGR